MRAWPPKLPAESAMIVVKGDERMREVPFVRVVKRGKAGLVARRSAVDLAEDSNHAAENAASLCVSGSLLDLEEAGKEFGDKWTSSNVGAGKRSRIIDDTAGSSLLCGKIGECDNNLHENLCLVATSLSATDRPRHGSGTMREGGRIHIREECRSRQQSNGGDDLFDRVNQ